MTSTTTCTSTAPPGYRLEPSPSLYGHNCPSVPVGCIVLPVADLVVGDVLQHDIGTIELVTSIDAVPGMTSRLVHVLRTMSNGRTVAASFWIGEHARRTVPKVVAPPAD